MPDLFSLHTPAAAWELFLQHFRPVVGAERIPTRQALGRVLAETLTAPEDLPGFRRSTVDGYAVRAADTYGASAGQPAWLTVIGEAPMGQAPAWSVGAGQAALVHTGGMLPEGTDAVVMIEHTQTVDATSIEVVRPVAVGENIIQPGEDVRAGDLLLSSGHRLRAQDLGGLLALGITEVTVAKAPRVAILSTGDEVVPPEQKPGPGQVRDVNSYTLAALIERAGGVAVLAGIIPDRRAELEEAARRAHAQAEIVLLSAGSSVSVRDLSADVIRGLGQPGILVHGVSMRPGKPTILAVCDGVPVFGLPGNPVSAMVVCELFVVPTVRALLGESAPRPIRVMARLARNLPSTAGREDYAPVRLEERDGELWAVPVFGKSNLIYTLVRTEGMVQVPLDSTGIREGEWVAVRLYTA